jgi:hypothetical protein
LLKNWKQYEKLAHGSNWNFVNYLCSNYVVRNWKGDYMKENFMPDFESRPAFSEQEYLWENHMKKGADCDVLDVDNFVEYLGKAVESKKGAEKWDLYRQYAEKGDWHNFGRAVYFLVHDYIEDELL